MNQFHLQRSSIEFKRTLVSYAQIDKFEHNLIHMSINMGYDSVLNSPETLVDQFEQNLLQARPKDELLLRFKHPVQVNNLISLLKDAERRIEKYEHIYSYIKEISQNQIINPIWYHELEEVLSWALKKGRGDRKSLDRQIKDAWLTYIIVLSCSMIDKQEKLTPAKSRLARKSERANRFSWFTENN